MRRQYNSDGYGTYDSRFGRGNHVYGGSIGGCSDRYGGTAGWGRKCWKQESRENRPLPFFCRNDGYDNKYGSNEMEHVSMTSKILAALSNIASKAKPNAKKAPSAKSSNLTYDTAIADGEYAVAGVRKGGCDE